MLALLVDTPTWLDLASRHDGHQWIAALRRLIGQRKLYLLAPGTVLAEPRRTCAAPDCPAPHAPLSGTVATENLEAILGLLHAGHHLEPAPGGHERGAPGNGGNKAMFSRPGHGIADAVLLELYLCATEAADLQKNPHAFVSTTPAESLLPHGETRAPHPHPGPAFTHPGSVHACGVQGLAAVLHGHFGAAGAAVPGEFDGDAQPRPPSEIQERERELADRIWYQQTLNQAYKFDNARELADFMDSAKPAMERIEAAYGQTLGPYSEFEWGVLNGKLSALQWAQGAHRNVLDA